MKGISRTATHRSGFTIVELLIVIVVIAILAALAFLAYNGIQNRAAEATLKSDLNQAAKSLGLEHAEEGRYPGNDGGTTDGGSLTKSSGTTFQYSRSGGGSNYCLTATSDRSGVPAFMITRDNTTPREGTCPGHTGPVSGGGGGPEIANNSPIQGVTQAQCAALPVFDGSNEGAVRTVTDSRGGTSRSYRIAKLADNKCWMLDNLKLGSTSGSITLTPSDSDVSGNFTLPQVTASGADDFDMPRVYGPVPGDTGSGHTNYGYLYNWSAASAGESRTTAPAGSGNASRSICADGWRLPTAGSGTGDFADLDRSCDGNGWAAWSSEPNISRWHNGGPFRGVLAGGRIASAAFFDQGGEGRWWSSTASSYGADAHALTLSNWGGEAGVVAGEDTYSRVGGYAVRCVLR